MAESARKPETTLYLKRTFPAPRLRVFEAWTNPEVMKSWFCPGEDYSTPLAEVDLRVGGRYRVAMKSHARNTVHTATGVYREIKSPERLVFTWCWEGEPENGESIVTLEFRDLGGSTELHLIHEHFPSEEVRHEHEKGWEGCLTMLGKALKS